MDLFPAAETFQHSPPHTAEEDKFFLTATGETLWDTLALLTPPVSPVHSHTTSEIEKHWQTPGGSLEQVDNDDDLPEELFSLSSMEREIILARPDSPAIVNDIMWNAGEQGERLKRPDSAMDIDVRFSLNGTPVCFEQAICNTFIDSEDLFSFSMFETQQDNTQDSDSFQPKQEHLIKTIQDVDTDEEIDVVSIHDEAKEQPPKLENENTSASQEQQNSSPIKPKILRYSQKQKDKKVEESSSSDSDSDNNRISHNDLERKRRNELRNRFNVLRENIPELEHSEKAAKITILQKAYKLIPTLQKEELRLIAAKEAEKRKNAALVSKLLKLTRASKATKTDVTLT